MHRTLSILLLSSLVTACAAESLDPASELQIETELGESTAALHRDDFSVGTFTEPLLEGGDEADFYYPIISRHHRRRFLNAFPVVAYLQGGLVDKSYYSEFCKGLAARGFVVVIPNTSATLPTPTGPAQFNAIASPFTVDNVLADVKLRDADPGSPLYKIADTTTLAVGGHSLGGRIALEQVISGRCTPGACFATYPGPPPPELKAAVLYGTHTYDNATGVALPVENAGVSTALFVGNDDGRAFPWKSVLTYPALELPRALLEFEGLNHFAITDVQVPAGAIPDPNPQSVPQRQGVQRLVRWTARYLHSELQGRRSAERWIYESGGSPSGNVVVTSER